MGVFLGGIQFTMNKKFSLIPYMYNWFCAHSLNKSPRIPTPLELTAVNLPTPDYARNLKAQVPKHGFELKPGTYGLSGVGWLVWQAHPRRRRKCISPEGVVGGWIRMPHIFTHTHSTSTYYAIYAGKSQPRNRIYYVLIYLTRWKDLEDLLEEIKYFITKKMCFREW